MKLAGALYRLLLHGYPAAFRERFGVGMEQAFRDRYLACARRGPLPLAAFLLRTLADVAGNAAAMRVQLRESTPMNWHAIAFDVRYAFRGFARNPLFAVLAVAALALGIGANTAIFTIVNGVLLKPLPYGEPDRLVMVWSTNQQEHRDRNVVSPLDFLDYRTAGAFADLQAAFSTWYLQNPPINPFIVIRTAGDPASLATVVRAEVQAVDKAVAAYDIRTMAQVRSESVAQRKFVLTLVGAFGVLALLMAAVGVYGVMALIVSERTAEIGIRLALGAQPSQVLRLVVVQGVALAAGGVAAGVAVSLAMAPLLRTQLFGIRPLDPATIAAVPALLLAVAALACYLPARRAMRIDPVNALRA